MRYFSSLIKTPEETWADWRGRVGYAVLRRISARHREQYRLEQLAGHSNCWEQLGQYQFNILTRHGLLPHHSVLEIGCGPLTVGVRLITYLERGKYVGVELREEPLAEAYRMVNKHGLASKNPILVKSDSFGKEELNGSVFDFIWTCQLSYHLDDKSMTRLFEQARVRSRAGTRVMFDVHAPDRKLPPNARWRGFAFHIRPLEFFRALGRRFGFSMRQRGRIEEYGYPARIRSLKDNLLLEFRRER